MIKHKKIIICILLIYALFIVGIFNVRADTLIGYHNGFNGNKSVYLQLANVSTSNSFSINSFNTGNADYILLPSTLFIREYVEEWTTGGGNNTSYALYDILSLQPYLGNLPCEFTTNGIKCPCNHNIDISGFFTIFSNGASNWSNNVYLSGTIDQNWQLYTSDISTIANNSSSINESINDSSIDNNNTSSSTTSWGNKNASNGTITNLLTLPISLLQAIVNGIQSSCTSFNLGSLFGTNIILPCINIGTLVGNTLWTTIDILFSGFMILAIAKKLIKIFNDFTNLKTNQVDELYGGGK